MIRQVECSCSLTRAAVRVPVEVSTYRLPLTWRQRVWRRPPWSLQWQWNRGWCWLSRPPLASGWVPLEGRWSPVWTLRHYFEIWTKYWAQSWSWEKLSQWSPGRRHGVKTWLRCKLVHDGRDEVLGTFCVAVLVVWMVGLVKVILTGDRCGGSELAMLCMMLLILGLLLMGTVMFLDTCGDTLVISFSITGNELDELVRLLLRGFSSSSEQLTP